MTAFAPVRFRIIAFVCAFALAFSLVPLAPGVHDALAAPALSVTFDEETGLATWKDSGGEGDYWCDVEVIGATEWEGSNVSLPAASPDAEGNCSCNFKDLIDDNTASGNLQFAAGYAIRIWKNDGSATPPEWTRTYNYKPIARKVAIKSYSLVTHMLTWHAVTDASSYICFIEGASASMPSTGISMDMKETIDHLIYNGLLEKSSDNNYQVTIRAYNSNGTAIAFSDPMTVYYNSAAAAVTVGDLGVGFDSASGQASWTSYPDASSYWWVVGTYSHPIVGTTANFVDIIDALYTSGSIGAADSHEIAVIAYNASDVVIARWAETFNYTPKHSESYVVPELPTLASVSFNASTGEASWSPQGGSNTYWYGIDGQWFPLGANTSANFKALLDSAYTSGVIPQNSSFEIGIRAYKGETMLVAQWSTTFAYTPQKVSAVTPPPSLPAMPVSFNASTGKATWNAYSGADKYWYGIDGKNYPADGRSVDFATRIDQLWASGKLSKKSSYAVSVSAAASDTIIAAWTGTFAYTPKQPSPLNIPGLASAAKLSVTFKSSTGKASWKSYSGAKVYFAAVDASIVAINGKKADFKDIIDGLYLSGSIKKKSSYEIAIAAYTAGSTKLLAAWTTKFTYTPAPNIKRANLAKIVNQEYTGKKLKPKLNMTIGIVSLKNNKHYKVKFKNNKKIGKATVTITGKGLVKGKLKKTFKIVPKAPGIKLTSTGVKTATVKWKHRTKGTNGVQIKYGYKANMKKAKSKTFKGTSKKKLKIKKLKSDKTVYTWIRCWKKVKGKKYYSSWNVIWYSVL